MAKYTCDFDAIAKASQNLEELANNVENDVKSGKNKLDSDLVSWSGTASEAYSNSSEQISSHLSSDAENMRNYSAYIKAAADKIEETEKALASIKI